MTRRILIAAPLPDELVQRISDASPEFEVELRRVGKDGWPHDWTTDAEVLYLADPPPRPEQMPNLRWIQCHWAGVDHLVGTPIWNSDVMITGASGIHAPNMGQYVLTQLLAWAHRAPEWFRTQQSGRWPEHRWDAFVPDELAGRTLGILGYGSIGREVARLASAFGMTILVTKRDARRIDDSGHNLPGYGDPEGRLPTRIYPPEATRAMLSECDYVVITLPLTPQTRHFFNEEVFRVMKPNAYLVNVGRGEIINESDLVRALKYGWIAGAGLDVFETEPLPEDSPLWRMENVVLTPHVSGFTRHYGERGVDLFLANMRRYLIGEQLINLVDRDLGY